MLVMLGNFPHAIVFLPGIIWGLRKSLDGEPGTKEHTCTVCVCEYLDRLATSIYIHPQCQTEIKTNTFTMYPIL